MNKQRIKANAVNTAANITYYGGTISAGLAFYHGIDTRNPFAVVALIVFVLTVEGLLRTVLNELLDKDTPQPLASPAIPAKTSDTATS